MTLALVTGAPGFVGAQLTRELLKNGYTVRALHRASSDTRAIDGLPVERVVGDITEPATLEAACKGVDVVFHLAALYRQAKFPDAEYFRVNVEGTRNMLDASIKAGVKKFVYCSTLGVHGGILNPPANETEAYRPGDVYQVSKTDAEKLVLEYIKAPPGGQPKIPGVIIRPAMIWGPGDTRLLKLFKGVKSRKLPIIGSGNQLVHWILVEDLARAFRLAAEKDAALGEVILIAGERSVSLRYTMERIAEYFRVSLLPFKVPALPLYLLGALMEAIFVPFGIQPPLFRRRVTFFTKSRAYDRSKASRLLGFEPSHKFEEEVALTCKWYQEHGWV